MASTGVADGHSARHGKVKKWLSEVFTVNTAALNWPRGVLFLDIAMVPLVLFWAIGHEEYLLAAIFGAFFTIAVDLGGPIGQRLLRLAIFTLVGAGVTAFGFSLDTAAWGWLVLASSLVTLIAGLILVLGVHAFVAGLLLNIWFIIAIAVGRSLHAHPRIDSHLWAQVAAWAGGSVLWIAVAALVWLLGGRNDAPQPFEEVPSDVARRALTQPQIAFSVLRAVAIAGAVALAYGLNLSHGYWLPVATIIALKPDLEQSTVMSAQRLIGALIGAVAAGLLLLIPANESGLRLFSIDRGLEVVAIVLILHAAAVRFGNYALYYTAVTAAVLTLLDLPQPTDYAAEGDRIAWTAAGVGIGVVVMFLAGLLAKRRSAARS